MTRVCPACGFDGASESTVVPGRYCPACGAVFRQLVTLRDPEGKLVAARRIKRALHAEADRVAGIDTSHLGGRGPMPAARLAWFREQAGRALSLREADELIGALPELLDEVDRLRAPSPPADPAAPWQLASDIPDGPPACANCGEPMQRFSVRSCGSGSGQRIQSSEHDLCLQCSPLGQLFRRRERRTLEQDVHDAVERGEVDDDHVMTESALVETTPLAVASYPGERDALVGFLECKGCAQPFPAADAHQLRVEGKLFAFHPGQFCPDCAAKYERGELVRPD